MGSSIDREIAERGIENTKKKEAIERLRRGDRAKDGKPIPVPPGVAETRPPKTHPQ